MVKVLFYISGERINKFIYLKIKKIFFGIILKLDINIL